MQIKRQDFINELRGNTSSSLITTTELLHTTHSTLPAAPPPPLLSAKTTDSTITEDSPTLVDLNSTSATKNEKVQPPNSESLLHPNVSASFFYFVVLI